ncbi:hypothetical protein GCM10010402_41210 [Actinomadura luteofluorescens]|uniref:SEFIR domain-containing protein n=1 Tax=Actinomadura luteofluorescens TaxID=46163 RepID=UPI0021648535|nr:SEFIR domain-containing protein [Actinomadura glauciflava]
MSEESHVTAVVRFSDEVEGTARSSLIDSLEAADLPASTGWDLEYRSPEETPDRTLALISYIADTARAKLAAASSVLRGWLRTVSAPGDRVFAELVHSPSGKTVRIRASDTDLAFHLLDAYMKAPGGSAPAVWTGLEWREESPRSEPECAPSPPEVFVSYAHDSDEHKQNVLRFCHLLAECGVVPRMDRWFLDSRRDWQDWATQEITTADFVVIVASPRCRIVGDGKNDPVDNRGLQSEMRLLRELYHRDHPLWSRKMLPVVLPGYSVDDIPIFLQPYTADHFLITSYAPEGAEDLLRLIHGRPPYTKPETGPPPGLH